jgi:UDP-glucose 4-epimerase
MHILITGGAGFIGTNLVEYHLKQGHRIHVVDDLSTGTEENLEAFTDNPDFKFDRDDILTWDGLENAVNWADRIYHLAAVVGVMRVLENPVRVLSINIAATERLLRMAHAGSWRPQIFLASTSEIYGHEVQRQKIRLPGNSSGQEIDDRRNYQVEAFREDMEPMVGSSFISRWNYPISKLADEALGMSYARKYDSPIVVARLFNTIGPHQRGRYGMVVPRFINQAVSGEPITVFGDGKQVRSFCDVRDTVAIIDRLLNNPDSYGQIVNVGGDHETSILELAELVRSLADSSSEITFTPYEEAYKTKFQDTMRRKPDLGKLFGLIDYQHQWTLKETAQDLITRKRN